jgi:hypothetical protein
MASKKIVLSQVEDMDAAVSATLKQLGMEPAVTVATAEKPEVQEVGTLVSEAEFTGEAPSKAETVKAEKKARKGTRKAKAADDDKAARDADAKAKIEAAFLVAKKADPVVEATIAAPAPEPVKPQVEDDSAELLSIMFGDDLPFYEEMMHLRAEAHKIHTEAKAADIFSAKRKMENEVNRLKGEQLRDAERRLYNTYKGMQTPAGDVQLAMFEKLQKAYRKFEDGNAETEESRRFAALRNAYVKNNSKMYNIHVENLRKAGELEMAYLEKEIAVEEKFAAARKLYEQANEIAMLYGWHVTTEKKAASKEVVNNRK